MLIQRNEFILIVLHVCVVEFDQNFSDFMVNRDSAVGMAAHYRPHGTGIESRWGRDFRARLDRPWGPSCLLYNGYRLTFPGVER